jgi:hypothetical protein
MLNKVHHSTGAATGRFPALLNATDEVIVNKVNEKVGTPYIATNSVGVGWQNLL